MPVTRYQIRNEYGLAYRELYGAADRDDPEALLEGVAMAGLVGVLRQLGDLAEFAAEIFHDLHEDAMATATRGHGLIVRVQQIEVDIPTVERALLSQTNHSSYFYNSGIKWRSNLRSEQNVVTRGDLPRFVMDSYEECRGPPRLFLLDKFDVAGAGACLKRYTDPSFFKTEPAYSIASEDMQRERKIQRVKHKKGSRWRNGETTPEVLLPSHAKLHELFLEECIENGYSDPTRRVKLKKRHVSGSAVDSRSRKSYMENFLETHSLEHKLICAASGSSPSVNLRSEINESGLRIVDISIVSPAKQGSGSSLSNEQEVVSKELVYMSNDGSFDEEIAKGSGSNSDGESDNSYSNLQIVAVENEMEVDSEDNTEDGVEGYSSDDLSSEVDNYVDALATMESEQETDNESRGKSNLSLMMVEKCRTVSDKNEEERAEVLAQSLDSHSNENSSNSGDWNISFERDSDSLNSDALSNLVENKPSECVCSESLDVKENGTNLHFMVVVPDDSSQAKDEFTSTSILPVVEADEEKLCATSDDTSHLKNAEESVCVKRGGDDSGNELFQEGCADEDAVGNFTSRKIDSTILDIPSTEEQLFPAATKEVRTSSDTLCFLPLNSLPDSRDPHLLEAEMDEVAYPKSLSDSEMQKELAEVVSSHSESDHFDQLEAASEQSPEFHCKQLITEDSHHDQDVTNSLNSQHVQVQILNQPDNEITNLLSTDHIIQETCLDASSDSLLQIPPSQPSNLVQPAVVDLEDRPPLPPLPPMQWRLGKMQHTLLASHRDLGGVSSGSFLPMQLMEANENAQFDLPVPQSEQLQPQNPFLSFTSEENMIVPGTESTTSRQDSSLSYEETVQPLQQSTHNSGLEPEDRFHPSRILEKEQETPLATVVTATTVVNVKPQYSLSASEGAAAWSSNTSDVMLDSEVGKSSGTVNKIPRLRNPLIDAVIAYGQSKLKKASERVQPQIEPKVNDNDLFLQQIRTKFVNLKPAFVTRSAPRPNIQGHNPNLKVMSLLERKASAIRQAFAGSDKDDDDSWSDS